MCTCCVCEASGLRPETRQGLCPLDPQQRARPFAIYQLGFVLRGGPTWALRGHGRPSPENNPINGFQGPLPLAEFQEAEPLGRGPGRKPRSFTGSSDCPSLSTSAPAGKV